MLLKLQLLLVIISNLKRIFFTPLIQPPPPQKINQMAKLNPREAAVAETEKLKQEVNLIEFARSYGQYEIDKSKTSNNAIQNAKYVKLVNPAEDIVIVSRKENGHWIYFNPNNSFDKGTVFDFLEKRMQDFSMKNAKELIYTTCNINRDVLKPVASSPVLKPKDVSELLSEFTKSLKPVSHSAFLEARGINQDETFKEAVKGRVFEEDYLDKYGRTHRNTVFPIHTKEKGEFSVCGYDRRNIKFKGAAEDSQKAQGIWESIPKQNTPVGAYIVNESPVDSLSFAELNPAIRSLNPVLAATNGTATDGHVHLICDRIEHFKPEKVILANDNDNVGEFFNAKLLAGLNASKFAESDYVEKNVMLVSAKVDVYRMNKEAMMKWQFSHDFIKDVKGVDKNEQLILAFKTVEDYYKDKNKELLGVNSDKQIFHIEGTFKPVNSEITISFANNKVNWTTVNESLVNLRYNYAESIEIQRPKLKDFNEDLMVSKGLKIATDNKIKEEKSNNLKI